MNILQQYVDARLKSKGLKRGNLPQMLGYTNASKCLRRFDAFVLGRFNDHEFLQRIRANEILYGEEFEYALKQAMYEKQIQDAEKDRVRELQARSEFVPHIWVIHENSVPSSIFVVGFLGLMRFKYMKLPDSIHKIQDEKDRLKAVERYFLQKRECNPNAEYLFGPFGRAKGFLYRDVFDHVHEYSLETLSFIDDRPFDWHSIPIVLMAL
jgi:hypothetical protein